jgi:methyl-CpG-binding domain protein 4
MGAHPFPYPPIPISPLNMLQEQQLGRPDQNWRILVCCMLLNMTHGRQVRPMIDSFFGMCPNPREVMIYASDPELTKDALDLLRPLGFFNRRWRSLTGMSQDYLNMGDPKSRGFTDARWVKSLRGCGQYAMDSIAIFVYGSSDNVSSDTWLNDYVEWRTKWLQQT